MKYILVNCWGDPINDDQYTLEEAEVECRKQWALGWEVYFILPPQRKVA